MPADLHTDAKLIQRLEQAAKREMSAEEVRMQRVSYVYGNMPHDAGMTRHRVAEVLARLEGEPA